MSGARRARYYPAAGQGGRRTIVGDIVVVLLLVLFAWMAFKVHGAIVGLADMTRGVEEAGASIRDTGRSAGAEIRGGFDSAADAVGAAPIVGGPVGDELRAAGDRSAAAIEAQARDNGARLEQAGREGTEDIEDLATLIGWLTFLVPTLLLLSQALPSRLRQLRGLRT